VVGGRSGCRRKQLHNGIGEFRYGSEAVELHGGIRFWRREADCDTK
jgi:hypothetical protein